MIYFTKGNFFGNLLHPFELKYRKFITEPPYPYNMCGIDLYSMYLTYSHLFNKRGGWNKRGGGAKVAKSLNVEAGINMEGGIFWKKLVHKSNKRGVEGGKI